MGFFEAISSVFSNYANFSGRARRSEYWFWALANVIVSSILSALAQKSGLFSILSGIWGLAIIIPSLAVQIRRLHDMGKSGWWMFISLVPLIGWIWLLILLCTDSQSGSNQYGANPKGGYIKY